MKLMKFLAVAAVFVAVGNSAVCLASFSDDDIAKIVEKAKANQSFGESSSISSGQIVQFTVSGILHYTIDLKAKLCFAGFMGGGGITPVPCKNIKEAYPMFARLVTWQ